MKVSIVVPVYNVPPPLLADCLSAVGRQTLRSHEHEIVIVDDGSTDAAVRDAVDQFADEHANCRVLRHDANRGLNQARLTGVRHACGQFVLFIDGDDVLTRDAAEFLYLEAIRSNADVVTAPFYRWSPESFSYYVSRARKPPYPQALAERMKIALSGTYPFTMCGRLFRRSLLDDTIFDMPDALPHEDLVTTVRLLFRAYREAAITQPVFYYTVNAASITRVFTTGHVDGLFYAVNDWCRQAEDRGPADELESSIQQGAERLVDMIVLRCLRSTDLTRDEKLTVLRDIDRRYDALPISRPEPRFPGTRILQAIGASGGHDPDQAGRVIDGPVPPEPWNLPRFDATLGPSDMARRLKNKVVIIGQVNYQVRNAALLARALRQRGHPCVVMDNSAVADQGRRRLGPGDKGLFWRTEHIEVRDPHYGADWLSTASVVITFNDFNVMLRDALEYRHRLGLPTVCMVEGINDFLRVDFASPFPLPYRCCDYVFLAGEDDAQYFEDRSTFLVGLPNVEALASSQPEFPREMLAVLNVNFTYGALEERRDEFVRAAQEAFDKLGIAWQITHHPMDKGDLSGLPVSPSTQQQLIDRCSVFVSRFATGIIEALACGKPVIYFNPHGERVAKFSEPLGAFEIARSSTELADALRRVEADIAAGVDFRARAAAFLRRHAGLGMPDGSDVSTRFSAAVTAVLDAHGAALAAGSELFLGRLEELEPFRQERPGLVLGDFSRSHGAQLNEEEMIGRCFGSGRGLMVDVGANFGNSLDVYLGKGWTVHAFEPDPNNRGKLELLWPDCEQLVINPQAVSDRDGLVVPLYASDESTGISSLSAFTDGHRQVAEVSTVTLATYMESAAIEHVDFLKVDVEGFDKFVLDGFPWERDRPDAVLVEFEDSKTVPLGYAVGDLVDDLQAHGYTVYVSEWHPIVRYGIAHDWKSLSRHDPNVDLSGTWGNLIAFRADPGEEVLSKAAAESLRFVVRKADPSRSDRADQPGRATTGQPVRSTPRSGARGGMTVVRMARLGSLVLRAARQHLIATAALAAAIVAATLLPIVADEPAWRPWSWAIALLLIGAAGGLAFAVAVREALRRLSRRQDRENAQLRRDLQRRLDVRTSRARQRADAVADELSRLRYETERHVDQLNHQARALRAALEESAEMATRSSEQVAAMQAAAADERRRSNYSNVAGFTVEDRYFSAEDAAHVDAFWLPKFGLSMSTRQLMYLAHDICRTEDRCEGRLATTIHAAVVRSLALMGLRTRNVELLKVGTLFGIGAGALYRTGTRVGKRVRLTLLDPLNSYHGVGFRDPTTGVPMTLEVVERNLNAMAVAESDARIVLGKRGDDEVVASLSDREYDYVLIDGEKTLRGVAADVARYGRHVRPGGMLVFDYDTMEWSHNEAFIEANVLGNGDWKCVGAGWRTVVLTRSPSPVGARVLGMSDRSSRIEGE